MKLEEDETIEVLFGSGMSSYHVHALDSSDCEDAYCFTKQTLAAVVTSSSIIWINDLYAMVSIIRQDGASCYTVQNIQDQLMLLA